MCPLSVIVPLAAQETAWPQLAAQLAALPADSEVVVVRADTHARARPAAWPPSLRYIEGIGPSGRARQMNLGARFAHGRWLWFVHADSRLLPDTLPALARFVEDDREALGWFDLVFHDGPRLARLNAWGANLRARWLRLPFGDQGFVLPARAFAALGGYDESAPYGEDHLLVWRARATGLPLVRVGAPLASSARKYLAHGWLATTLRHWRRTVAQAWPAWRRLHGRRT